MFSKVAVLALAVLVCINVAKSAPIDTKAKSDAINILYDDFEKNKGSTEYSKGLHMDENIRQYVRDPNFLSFLESFLENFEKIFKLLKEINNDGAEVKLSGKFNSPDFINYLINILQQSGASISKPISTMINNVSNMINSNSKTSKTVEKHESKSTVTSSSKSVVNTNKVSTVNNQVNTNKVHEDILDVNDDFSNFGTVKHVVGGGTSTNTVNKVETNNVNNFESNNVNKVVTNKVTNNVNNFESNNVNKIVENKVSNNVNNNVLNNNKVTTNVNNEDILDINKDFADFDAVKHGKGTTNNVNNFVNDQTSTVTTTTEDRFSHTNNNNNYENHKTSEELRREAESAHYKFSTFVDDNINGESQVRKEVRDGTKVTGLYSYDDGTNYRTTWYKADENGFVVIKNEVQPSKKTGHLDGTAVVKTYNDGNSLVYKINGNNINHHPYGLQRKN